MRTETTTALLEGLMDADNARAWREFDARYRPVLKSFALALNLDHADAADVAQETLTRFVRSYRAGKYDRSRGRLQSWLVGIAKHCISDLLRQQGQRREHRGLSAIGQLADDDRMSQLWESQYQRSILQQGLHDLRFETRTDPHTIRAFEMLTIDQQSASDVARALNISLNDVYLAKHRCLKRLRDILARLSLSYDLG